MVVDAEHRAALDQIELIETLRYFFVVERLTKQGCACLCCAKY